RWSPDGKIMAFLSNSTETTQIYLMPVDGGEAEALTQSKTGIRSFVWSPDGKQIAYLSSEPKTEEEEKKLKEKDDAYSVDRNIKDPLLRVINLESREVRQLTREPWRVSEFAWMPKGDQLLISATDHPRRDFLSNRFYLISADDGNIQEISRPPGLFGDFKISPDGKTMAYIGSRPPDNGPCAHDLFIQTISGGSPRNLTAQTIDRPINSFIWLKDGSFLALCSTGFTSTFYNISRDGKAKKYSNFDVSPSNFVSGPELMAFIGETATQTPELWISTRSGHAEKMTHFNKEWDDIPLVKPEIVTYTSFDGMKIEAALFKPAGYQQGIRVPFVVLIHGGPTGRFADRIDVWSQLLATRGYAVLLPNIRGSIGYGQKFAAINRYDWGGGDWKDVMAGVDFVIEQGIADPEKLGIGGWSYGGYMAAWAVTQTNRFKASVSGAPMTDLASEFGTESHEVNIGDTWALGTPYENLNLFIQRSPVTFVKNVKTPTLLLNGEKDLVDPIGQCQQFYRGLRRYDVETEFVVYPRMGHVPREEKHWLDVMNRMLYWFEKYLK
ncbi:MAG: S9 family peptidase, partial [Deltaproteobacteria bacterium]|nr:S9 family peptidase [Deltaproteobacteria bacterium]